jgi:hypothetical protein
VKLLLLTPPLVQLNTPYPATAYLTGYLRRRGWDVVQADPGLEWALRLLGGTGISALVRELEVAPAEVRARPPVAHLLAHAAACVRLADPVLALLQGRETGLVHRIAARGLLPEGGRFSSLGPPGHEDQYLEWAFGGMGVTDRARYFATLFVEDLADAVREGVDPHFGLARYAESIAMSPPTLAPLLAELDHDARLTARTLAAVTVELLERHAPDVVGMSLPFPGNVLGALRMARVIRAHAPATRIVWGGGWVNTELRELDEPRLFELVDAVCYDDGERPLELLLERWSGRGTSRLRTRERQGDAVVLTSDAGVEDVPFAETGAPTYVGLPLERYLGLVDLLNPMHRLWNDTRWNKLTVAHGCYWRRCNFCDVSLDYIRRYDPLGATALVDRIEALIAETGTRGFHFVDEAAPPAALRMMSEELLARGIDLAWWGNIRFERTFTPELCKLLARAGCIAVTGGLEVASNRLLELMNKGVTVEQVARVTRGFAAAGIRVHAYLMYGFPSQTEQETIDSLEYVRQLFVNGCLDSAYWHRLSTTQHAPLGLEPERFGIELVGPHLPAGARWFAKNDLDFVDPTGVDHDMLGLGLRKGLYNYMLGLGLEEDVRAWFPRKVPKTTVHPDFIARALAGETPRAGRKRAR